MLAYPIATAAILLMGQQGSSHAAASTAPKKKSPPNKIDFLRAMNRHSKRRTLSKETEADFKRELYGSTKHSAALRKKLMKRSVVTKTPGSSSSTVESSTTASTMARTTNQGSKVMKKHDVDGAPHRKLEDANNNNNYQNDGTDDYFSSNQADWENEVGFDVTQYAASYAGCASVAQFDDEMAATEGTTSVFATKQFVVFRFCPAATCMGWQEDYSQCGCDDQCDSVMEYEGYSNEDDDASDENEDDDASDSRSDLCTSACIDACSIWGVQQNLNSRKLEDNNNNNWNMNYQNEEYNPYSE